MSAEGNQGAPSPSAAAHRKARAVRAEVRERAAEALPAAPEQAELLPLPAVAALESIGPGRPSGAGNRRTREWVEFLLQRYRSPLVALLEAAARPVEDLAAELGCTRGEAFDRQLRALGEVLPYLHQKLPQAIQVDGVPVFGLAIGVAPGLAAKLSQPAGGTIIEVVEDQALAPAPEDEV